MQIAIACGGTGGHLFPGLSVAESLRQRGCAITLMISPKEVDQHAVQSARGMEVVTLPAVGLTKGRGFAFVRGFLGSYRAARQYFRHRMPDAALAMGGFTSAPPVLAARRFGARTYLHESNIIPGRANRWLSWSVDQAFVGFEEAGRRLHGRATRTGTPVRFRVMQKSAREARQALGLDGERPVLLVMGGSQGASGINQLILQSLPTLAKTFPELQLFHLAGPNDAESIRRACSDAGVRAVVHGFFSEMELAFAASTACVSRAGASSLAELAAMRLPSVLVPYPAATDNHQHHNAEAFERTGAALLLHQEGATPESLHSKLRLIFDASTRERMQAALAKWHAPGAADSIADTILAECRLVRERRQPQSGSRCSCGCHHPRQAAHGKAGV